MITCTFENGSKSSMRHVTANCMVIRGDELLLAKRAEGLLEAGKWCFVGGYVDRDETVEEAAIREAKEESGYGIHNLRLLRLNDNPDRPHEDRQNIDFIYLADVGEKVGEKDWESEEVQWFDLDALPPAAEIAFDHFESIELYKRYREKSFPIPVIGRL